MCSVPDRAERPLGRLAVLGLGLMGGSLARGVSALQVAHRVTGWSPQSTERDAALTAGAVSLAAGSWRDAVADADLVVLAVPLQAAVELVGEVGAAAPPGATVTDLSSLKLPVLEAVRAAGLEDRWVGSHPMAGGETSGFWASRADLYHGARVWTVADGAHDEHLRRVDRLWRALGAEPAPMRAERHDRLMARVSHLPQLVSNILASVLADSGTTPDRLGPGGRDMTRLAASGSDMWLDILQYGSPELVDSLRALAREAGRVADLVEATDLDGLDALLRRSRSWKVGS